MKNWVALSFLIAAFLLPQLASAANRHTIASASQGYRDITNVPNGYFLGRAYTGWTVDNHKTSGDGFFYTRVYGGSDGANICGWLSPGSLAGPAKSVPDSCQDSNAIKARTAIGTGFNCAENAGCKDGKKVNVSCSDNRVWANYSGGGFPNGFHKQVGTATQPYYRFTTRDGAAAVVRVDGLGWGFMRKGCIAGFPQGEN